MNVNVPPSLKAMEPALSEFFEGMIHKLNVNSHKKGLEEQNIPGFIDLMLKELVEFKEQIEIDPKAQNVLEETWDGSNFWFLMYAYLRKKGVHTMRERFLNEYYQIFPDKGMVVCIKSRSGSVYKPGDEIKGTKNSKGEVLIRTQSAAGGFAVTLLRSHIMYWKVFGRWPDPECRVVRMNEDPADDSMHNLRFYTDEEESKGRHPFVFQYAPAGRESSANYGKFGYQRRHLFKLVRVGYWDTEEEASTEGLKKWKEKTSCLNGK